MSPFQPNPLTICQSSNPRQPTSFNQWAVGRTPSKPSPPNILYYYTPTSLSFCEWLLEVEVPSRLLACQATAAWPSSLRKHVDFQIEQPPRKYSPPSGHSNKNESSETYIYEKYCSVAALKQLRKRSCAKLFANIKGVFTSSPSILTRQFKDVYINAWCDNDYLISLIFIAEKRHDDNRSDSGFGRGSLKHVHLQNPDHLRSASLFSHLWSFVLS